MLSHFSHIRFFATTWTVSSVHGDSPGKDIGVGCHALLQGIFLTQGLNPHLLCLLHGQEGSLPLVALGSPYTVKTYSVEKPSPLSNLSVHGDPDTTGVLKVRALVQQHQRYVGICEKC